VKYSAYNPICIIPHKIAISMYDLLAYSILLIYLTPAPLLHQSQFPMQPAYRMIYPLGLARESNASLEKETHPFNVPL
jgi:hypothetical protein